MDTKSVVDLDVNVVDPGEADKSFENTASALPDAVVKGVGNAKKGICGVENGVGDIAKSDREFKNGVCNADKGARAPTSDFLG